MVCFNAETVCAADCRCCVLMSGTGFVAPADLPLSDEEDVEQAAFACLFACLTLKRCCKPPQTCSSWFWFPMSCFAWLSRYKVPLLKPHLRDMLASARRRRAFRCFSWVCLHDQMFDICKWCKQQRHTTCAWNVIILTILTKMRWAGCEGSFTFSKPQSIAKRQEFWGFVGLEWWSQWGNLWQQLDLLSQSFCDKLKNVQPETCSHKAEFGSKKASKNKRTDSACLIPYPVHHPPPYMQHGVFQWGDCLCCGLQMLCFDVRHWFRSSGRPATVRWRRCWAGSICMFICMSHIEEMLQTTANLQFLILVSHVMLCLTVQVQSAPAQASSQRHVGFGQETEGFSMLFMGLSSWSDVWYLQVM